MTRRSCWTSPRPRLTWTWTTRWTGRWTAGSGQSSTPSPAIDESRNCPRSPPRTSGCWPHETLSFNYFRLFAVILTMTRVPTSSGRSWRLPGWWWGRRRSGTEATTATAPPPPSATPRSATTTTTTTPRERASCSAPISWTRADPGSRELQTKTFSIPSIFFVFKLSSVSNRILAPYSESDEKEDQKNLL